ncbi:MAG TPA: 3-phosphoshikimate 1-carboxyvinyltransferase [Candidatus Acidoferrales bacterium]|nr:3-phosphoshikimate 1-carboxyvinyltransferase [Candidatus Acidoferrales bacterium]
MAKRVIAPAGSLSGGIVLPGDKSISHRLAILAALAEGPSEIRNFSPSADCASTLECLQRLGISLDAGERAKSSRSASDPGTTAPVVRITGRGLGGWREPRRTLDAGNSGTTIRLLAGALAGQAFASRLSGDSSLRRRPMRRVIDPLAQMGASIRSRDGGFAPLEISGAPLRGIEYALPEPSAQVKSALLLAGLFASGTTAVIEPVRTRDHTELALAEFGVAIRRNGLRVEIPGGARLGGREMTVPGDLSAAVFFLAAASILPGSKLTIFGVGLNPTRSAVLDFLVQMGAAIRVKELVEQSGELGGEVEVASDRSTVLRGGKICGAEVARMIDELPMLAALGPYTQEGIEIRDARELRVKESDRIAVLAENLRRMGARVEEFEDGLRVAGRAEMGSSGLQGAELDPRGDHRLAMALAVAALGGRGASTIRGAECVAVSYPDFFAQLDSVLRR